MIKPDWWNLWVVQGLYNTIVRDNAPNDVKKAFKKWQKDQQPIKGIIST